MLVQILGKAYIVWDRAARIEFVKPGRGTVTAVFRIDEAQVEEIVARTDGGQKFLPEYAVAVLDETGEQVARVTKTLYIKRKKTGGMQPDPN
jgi:acyl-coenzyme A thioesterase PaaI-like protein